jgi:hypothetical protein
MKKSKFFIGLSLLVIAIAGAAVTKANTHFSTVWFQTTPTSCISENVTQICATGGEGCLDAQGNQIYVTHSGDGHTCVEPLQLESR